MNRDDAESVRVQVVGVRRARGLAPGVELAGRRHAWPTSSWPRASWAIEGIDTRRLTLRLREHGAMRAAISTADVDAASLVRRVQASPGMEGADLARDRVGRAAVRGRIAWSGPADGDARRRVPRGGATTSA